jgi:PAS domain S-box
VSRKIDPRITSIVEKIRILRISKRISIEELATRADVSRSYIYYIETKKKIPTLTILFKLADALDIDIADLFVPVSARQTEESIPVEQNLPNPDQTSELLRTLAVFNTFQKREVRPGTLTWREVYLLLSVKQHGAHSISSLAADLDMPVLEVSRMVSELKARNMLYKRLTSSDRRIVLSVLTDAGRMVLEKNERYFANVLNPRTDLAAAVNNTEDCVFADSVQNCLQCCFTPLFNAYGEIIDLEFYRANKLFIEEFPRSRTLRHSTLLSRTYYQHFSTILSACSTVWRTGKPVTMVLDASVKGKGYTCEFSRTDEHIIVCAEVIRKSVEEYLNKLLPNYTYFYDSRPAKLVVDCRTGRILEVNKAAVGFYGWTHEEFLRKTIYEISMNDPAVVKARLEGGGENGAGSEKIFHAVHRLAGGKMKKLEVHISSCVWGQNRIQYVTVVRDTFSEGSVFLNAATAAAQPKRLENGYYGAAEYGDGGAGIRNVFELLEKEGRICSYSPGEHFFEYGTLVPTFGFILDGILRVYYETDSGHECTLEYLTAGGIIDSLTFSTVSSDCDIIIEAVIPAKVLVIDQDVFRRRVAVDSHAFEFAYNLEKSRLCSLEKHIKLLLSDNARKRYEQFIRDEKELASYLNGQNIASYLGITPETLSRIRNAD